MLSTKTANQISLTITGCLSFFQTGMHFYRVSGMGLQTVWYGNCDVKVMIENNSHEPIEELTGPDDIISTNGDDQNKKKDAVQRNLEGAEPSREETEVDDKDSNILRSE